MGATLGSLATRCDTADCVAFVPDCQRIAASFSSTGDPPDTGNTREIFDVSSGRVAQQLRWIGGEIEQMAFSPDDNRLAVALAGDAAPTQELDAVRLLDLARSPTERYQEELSYWQYRVTGCADYRRNRADYLNYADYIKRIALDELVAASGLKPWIGQLRSSSFASREQRF